MWPVLALLFLAADDGRGDADRLFASGRYDEAANAYVRLLETSPNDLGLLEHAGNSYLAQNRPTLAIPFFKRALALSPNDLDAARQLATAFSAINEFGEAQSLLAHVAQLDPADAVTWFRLGVLMYMRGAYPSAVEDLDRALALGFAGHGLSGRDSAQYQNRAEVVRAVAQVEMGRPAEAAKELPKLMARPENAGDLTLRFSWVELLYDAGRYQEAIQQVDIALASSPENSSAHFWRARILSQQQKVPEAIAEAEKARDLSPESPGPRGLLVRLYQKVGQAADAGREAEWLRAHEAAAPEPAQ
ncbi:MAG TPA: tetratricopeptide repeat protein [Bryobacteraceae bacterium]